MPTMLLPIADEILDAAEHLPGGAMLVMPRVSWDDYERVLERLAERPHFRVSYDRGILEIMSPRSEHGAYEHLISDLILVACQVLRLKIEKCGSTTWKGEMLGEALELSKAKGQDAARVWFRRKFRSLVRRRQEG